MEESGRDKAEYELNDTEPELCKCEAGCESDEECTDQRLGDAYESASASEEVCKYSHLWARNRSRRVEKNTLKITKQSTEMRLRLRGIEPRHE